MAVSNPITPSLQGSTEAGEQEEVNHFSLVYPGETDPLVWHYMKLANPSLEILGLRETAGLKG